MGNFAENLNLGNRFRPPLIRSTPAPNIETWDFVNIMIVLIRFSQNVAKEWTLV